MREEIYNDEIARRNRKPFYLLLKDRKITRFRGESIKSLLVIITEMYEKKGSYSSNSYRFAIADGVKTVFGSIGWDDNAFCQGIALALKKKAIPETFEEISILMDVSKESVIEFLDEFNKEESERLKEVDKLINELKATGKKFKKITVKFGNPTNHEIKAGFWKNDKEIKGIEGKISLIDKEKAWNIGNIVIKGIEGKILSVNHTTGYGGGTCSVSIGIVE